MGVDRRQQEGKLLSFALHKGETRAKRVEVQTDVFVFVQVLSPHVEGAATGSWTPDAMKYRQRATSNGKEFDRYRQYGVRFRCLVNPSAIAHRTTRTDHGRGETASTLVRVSFCASTPNAVHDRVYSALHTLLHLCASPLDQHVGQAGQ